MTNYKTAILISGMHRSGTSSVAGIIGMLGAALPVTLLLPQRDNLRGFFESGRILQLNERILATAGTYWYDWRALDNDWAANPLCAGYLEEAEQILAEEYGDARLIVVKDPRFSRLLSFWSRALELSGFRVCHIIPLRHPAEVAESIARRDRLPHVVTRLSWTRHLLDAERYSRGMPRAFLEWDTLMRDWEVTLRTVGEQLSVTWPQLGDAVRARVDEFLVPDLRHHRTDAASQVVDAGSDYSEQVYEILRQLVKDPASQAVQGRIDAIRRNYAGAERSFAPLITEIEASLQRVDAERQNLGGMIEVARGQLESTGQILAETAARLAVEQECVAQTTARLQAALEDRDRTAIELAAAVRDRDTARSRWMATTAELEQTRKRLKEAIQERDALALSVQEKAAQIANIEQHLEDSRERARSAEDRLDLLRNRTGWQRLMGVFRVEDRLYRSDFQDQEVDRTRPRWSLGAPALNRPAALLSLRELLALNGIEFLVAAYGRLLKRLPDDSGISHYLPRLMDGAPKVQLLGELAASGEARALGTHVPGLAIAVLRARLSRVPLLGLVIAALTGADGNSAMERRLRGIDQTLRAGGDAAGAVQGEQPVPNSLEALLRLQGRAFLDAAYRAIMRREPDATGTAFYLPRLRNGVAKMQILGELAGSHEARDQGTPLPGLQGALLAYRLGKLPLLGWLLRRVAPVEGDSELETRLRAVEQSLHSDVEPADSAGTPASAADTPAPLLTRRVPLEDLTGLRRLVMDSGLFDEQWYRAQPPGLGEDEDPLDHYLNKGWLEGRSPSEKFNGETYLYWYPDVRKIGANPLAHYLQHGKKERRRYLALAEAEQLGLLKPIPVTDARIACLKAVDVRGEAAVFVTHSPDGLIKPHVVFYLSALHRHGIGVVLLIVADCPVEPLPDEQLDLLAGVYVRENKGYDFAAWAHVLQLHPELFAAPILYFLNDSIFGPLNEVKFSTLLERIRASDSDFIGLTDSEEHEWHMQSYFLACKNAALSSAAFHRFINGISSLADKDDVIRNYELKFAAYVRDRGLKVEVVFDAPYTANPERPHNKTLFYWKGLIEEGFPFVKVGAIRRDDPLIDIDDWEAILTREGYDTQLVEKTLTLTAKPVGAVAKPAKAQRHELLAVPVTWPRAADAPLKVALIGPWNYDNGLGFASRGYLAALWHTNFLVNIHPIRTPFHIHRQMAPMVEYRSFSGDADLVIVHLNPDGWFSVLTDEQRAIIARAGKVVGAWVWETQNIPENWYPGFDSVHAIWAPSKYCAEVFASASRAPVEVVPYFIAVRPPSLDTVRWEALRRDLEIELGQRMILYCFDGASYLVRKNPGALVAAFERSGLAADGWLLVLKTKNLFDSPAQGQQLSELVGRTPGVRLINQSYDPALMDVLMNIADIYASPHCSEGFGMTIAEAMALGKVVVATDFAGSRDFVDETCGYPVPYRLHALTEDYGHYLSGSVWADVDQEALAALLRTAADRVVRGDHSIGRAARGRILQHYSPQAIGDAMQRAAAALFGA